MNIINFYNEIKSQALPLIVVASIFSGLSLISLKQTDSTYPYENYSYPDRPNSNTKAATLQCYRKVKTINDTLSYCRVTIKLVTLQKR